MGLAAIHLLFLPLLRPVVVVEEDETTMIISSSGGGGRREERSFGGWLLKIDLYIKAEGVEGRGERKPRRPGRRRGLIK